MRRTLAFALLPLLAPSLLAGQDEERIVRIVVEPDDATLDGPEALLTLLVTGVNDAGKEIDLTREAQVRSDDAAVARIGPRATVLPTRDGLVALTVNARGHTSKVRVTVRDSGEPRRFNFENSVVPVLSKLGCNGGSCHGKAEGQNGFKLSLFGFDPAADYAALVKESQGRRIMPGAPASSLLVLKALGQIPHGGGVRTQPGSAEIATLVQWIGAGVPFGGDRDPGVDRIEVRPRSRTLAPAGRQQLQVTAILSDGRRRDVTPLAIYSSNEPAIATVDAGGLVEARDIAGEAAVMVSYLGKVDVARIVIPRKLQNPFRRPPEQNFIDGPAWDRLRLLGIQPSEPCGDTEFLRRVSLDLIGTLPTPHEVRALQPGSRAQAVDRLLARPEFADYWALKWADVLRVDRQKLQAKGALVFYEWLRESFRQNKPYDRFVREILTAQGSSERVGPVNLYRVLTTPEQTASSISQVFLGVRIECAQCHHHPFDKWGQDDFYGMTGFFTRVKRDRDGNAVDLSIGPAVPVKHPRTGATVPPRALEAPPAEPGPEADPRVALADWMTSRDNRWFARAIANRLWAHFFGRGLVEPVDDMRDTAPASNEPLLSALARHLVESGFDLKALMRAIVLSAAYQRSSAPNGTNAADGQNFSRAYWKPLPAEVLLDAISQATGSAERFPLLPAGTRAIQVWDNRLKHYFFEVFGRPLRTTACECERISEPSVAQVLHLMNAPEIHAKVRDPEGRVRRLLRSAASASEIVEELYLATYGRKPDDGERRAAAAYLEGGDRARSVEDLLWALLNTKEFLYNH